jgi:hypothetical protein
MRSLLFLLIAALPGMAAEKDKIELGNQYGR